MLPTDFKCPRLLRSSGSSFSVSSALAQTITPTEPQYPRELVSNATPQFPETERCHEQPARSSKGPYSWKVGLWYSVRRP